MGHTLAAGGAGPCEEVAKKELRTYAQERNQALGDGEEGSEPIRRDLSNSGHCRSGFPHRVHGDSGRQHGHAWRGLKVPSILALFGQLFLCLLQDADILGVGNDRC